MALNYAQQKRQFYDAYNKEIGKKSIAEQAIAILPTGLMNLDSLLFGQKVDKQKSNYDLLMEQRAKLRSANPGWGAQGETTSNSGSGSSGSGGAGSGGMSNWYLSGDEIAKRFGIKTKESDLYNTYMQAVNAQFNESDAQMQRAKDENLRTLRSQYEQSLIDARNNRANAVATGITKGTAAASQISSMLGMQQAGGEQQTALNDILVDLANQRGTALAGARTQAQTDANTIAQYLAQMGAAYQANDVNKYAADATRYAANVTAGGTAKAANSAYDFLYNLLNEQYGPATARDMMIKQLTTPQK